MKTRTKLMMALLALGFSAWMITAQNTGANNTNGNDQQTPPAGAGPDGQPGPGPGPGGPGGRAGRHRPPPPIIAALDANHDGVIDESEIANAPAALRTLDKNGDGKLTMDELMPPPPPRGEGRPPGPGGPPPEDGNGQ
jgi:hypothetical protein